MKFSNPKKALLPFLVLLAICLIVYFSLGYLNSYLGYYGYDKDQFRRFSASKKESLERGVFVRDLAYHDKSKIVREVFIEKGFKWGNSSRTTRDLAPADSLHGCFPFLPFQVVIAFNKRNKDSLFFIPESIIYIPDSILPETLLKDIYVRDTLNNFMGKEQIEIWP
ncbi:MAG: hypothetical protein H6581_24285 [Bacteroidia bacterium]|nr:hypothetical protein [Bacteroidia bacterium]